MCTTATFHFCTLAQNPRLFLCAGKIPDFWEDFRSLEEAADSAGLRAVRRLFFYFYSLRLLNRLSYRYSTALMAVGTPSTFWVTVRAVAKLWSSLYLK